MLSSGQFNQLCQDLGLSREARAIIEEIRASPPSRRAPHAAGNVSVRYPSRKMGVTIQAESHRNELAGIYEMEHDPETLEYYDQPPPIKLLYQAQNGRRVGVLHTPDHFVLRTDGAGWEEWKTEDELLRLLDGMPHRYVRGEAEGWRCPPGERYTEPFGLFYRVRSSAGIEWVLQRNLLFLEDYLRADCPPVADKAARAVLGLVAGRPGIPLDQLLEHVEGAGSDDVYALIATGRLFVDLRGAALAEPERVRVFGDEAIGRAEALVGSASDWLSSGLGRGVSLAVGTSLVWDPRRWPIVNRGATSSSLLGEDGALIELPNATFAALADQGKRAGLPEPGAVGISPAARERLGRPGPAYFREANRRYEAIAARLSTRASPTPSSGAVGCAASRSTMRAWPVAPSGRSSWQRWSCADATSATPVSSPSPPERSPTSWPRSRRRRSCWSSACGTPPSKTCWRDGGASGRARATVTRSPPAGRAPGWRRGASPRQWHGIPGEAPPGTAPA